MNGVVDVHAVENDRVLVVDWKSDPLLDREPEQIVAGSYSTQRIVYVLAVLRSGAERWKWRTALERPDEPATAKSTARQTPARSRTSCSGWRGVVESTSSPPRSRTLACAATAPAGSRLCSYGPN